jgi:hypothetical protein
MHLALIPVPQLIGSDGGSLMAGSSPEIYLCHGMERKGGGGGCETLFYYKKLTIEISYTVPLQRV